jgi:transcriptional regulator with XRE-family HTH domain
MPRSEDPQPGLAKAIRRLRKDAGLSQQALSERIEIHPTGISHIESGRVNPTWANVRRIAQGIGVPLGVLADAAQENENDPLTSEFRAGTYEFPEPPPPEPAKPPPAPPAIPEPLVEDLDDLFLRFEAFRDDLKAEAEAQGSV